MPWRVCLTEQAIPPYLNAPGQPPGVAERLIRDAAGRVGLAVVVQRQPSPRCYALLSSGKVEASLAGAAVEHQTRMQFPLLAGRLDPSKRVASLRLVWIKRRDAALDWDGRQLLHVSPHNVRVGTLQVNQMATEVLQPLGVVHDNAANDTVQLLGKLLLRRIDAAVVLQEEFEALHGTPVTEALRQLPQPLRAADYYLAVKRQLNAADQALAQAWWSAIANLRDTPAYQPR